MKDGARQRVTPADAARMVSSLVRKLAVLGPTPMKHWQRFNGRTGVEFKALQGEPVKIGSPHFMDFGENPEHSPDGKA